MKSQIPIEDLLNAEESETLDFKRTQYTFHRANDHQKSELLKDILSFANSWRRTDAYILIGVEEVKGSRSIPTGISEDLDDAQLQEFVNKKLNRPIVFSYHTTFIDNVKIGIIKIPVQKRPCFLIKDFGRLKRNVVYIRRNSSTDISSPEEVYSMGSSEITVFEETPNLKLEIYNSGTRNRFGSHKTITLSKLPNDINSKLTIYRDHIWLYNRKQSELCFCICNYSNRTFSDIKVEIPIQHEKYAMLFHENEFTNNHISKNKKSDTNLGVKSHIKLTNLTNEYLIEIFFNKILPKEIIYCEETLSFHPEEGISFNLIATIYANNLLNPIEQQITISKEESRDPEHIPSLAGNNFTTNVINRYKPNLIHKLFSKLKNILK